MQFICIFFVVVVNVCSQIFFRRMFQFWYFLLLLLLERSQLHDGSIQKHFLYLRIVNLSVCQFNILFGYNLRKNRIMARIFWYFLNYTGLFYTWKIVIVSYIDLFTGKFNRAKFQYIIIFYSFLMTQIGTKFQFVFKLHRSDLHTKISHRILHIFYRALQVFENIKICCSVLMTQNWFEIFVCLC